ncbi:hypothetical protein ACKI2C_49375, partial [Streptomyces brasiliscabiei]|uniref:hypothetical protein n=1 Tax=Streptomyces brasiliscabiei TaxID=2736302 RepID=UPI0038F683B9
PAPPDLLEAVRQKLRKPYRHTDPASDQSRPTHPRPRPDPATHSERLDSRPPEEETDYPYHPGPYEFYLLTNPPPGVDGEERLIPG